MHLKKFVCEEVWREKGGSREKVRLDEKLLNTCIVIV